MSVIPFATDEDIAIRAAGDFAVLCPKDQKYAAAIDGVIPANSWTLTSASIASFEAFGVEEGHIVQLIRSGTSGAYRPIAEQLVVDSVSGGTLTLRRKGMESGVGSPPGGPSGLTGVEFLIATLAPQIEDVSYDLNRRYGINDLVSGRRTADLYDPREVRQACVLSVLQRQYFAEARRAGSTDDSLYEKGRMVAKELSELLARVVVHWMPVSSSGGASDVTSPFSTRISR